MTVTDAAPGAEHSLCTFMGPGQWSAETCSGHSRDTPLWYMAPVLSPGTALSPHTCVASISGGTWLGGGPEMCLLPYLRTSNRLLGTLAMGSSVRHSQREIDFALIISQPIFNGGQIHDKQSLSVDKL